MANVGSKGILRHIDDPEITVINTSAAAGKTWVSAGDTSDTAFVKAVAVGKGLHYAGTVYQTNNNMLEFSGNSLMFSGQEGHSEAEIMLQMDDVSNVAFNFGFNDQVLETANSLPIEIGTTTVSANSATFVGIAYDTGATNDELHCVWVDDSTVGQTDSTGKVDGKYIRMHGMAPTNSKWLYMKVEIDDIGSGNGVRATFLAVDHTARSVEKVFDTTVDRNCALAYYFGIENRTTSAVNVYLRHNDWAQTIADM